VIHPAPRKRGRGTALLRGGRGAGLNDLSAPTTKRRVRGPLHRANARSPSPASRGRIKRSRSRGAYARECCQTAMSNICRVGKGAEHRAHAVHHRSIVRVGFAALSPPYKRRKEIKGSGTPADALFMSRTQAARGSRHGKVGLRRPFRYRARSPASVPPRLSPKGVVVPKAQLQARLPGTRPERALPAVPVPVQGCTSRPGHNAGRLMPKPPGSGVQIRPRAPPSPHPAVCLRTASFRARLIRIICI
jgi:hypothetical protein